MARVLLIVVTLVFLICFCKCNIHRTIYGNRRNPNRHLERNELIEEVDEDAGLLDHLLHKNKDDTLWFYPWLFSIPASILVGSTGIFPLLIFTKVNCPSGGGKLNEAISPAHLRLLLAFSVGGLFGDVFLHLLPEAWMHLPRDDHLAGCRMGLWIIGGLICFLIIEKIFSIHEEINSHEDTKKTDGHVKDAEHSKDDVEEIKKKVNATANGVVNGHVNGIANGHVINGYTNCITRRRSEDVVDHVKDKKLQGDEINQVYSSDKKIIGYLNLLANSIDNFTHGLAVAGSFMVSLPVGICTTFAILLHEIPHEIGDFAILLSAGFNRWEAAKGQMITASGALVGCLFGLLAEGAGDTSAWVLPFTSGSFIYISCATVIPELLKETSFIESVKQMVAMFTGIAIMSLVSVCH